MIINDDILNWCKEYKGEKFHSLVCDPPYHLTEITLQSMNLSGRTVEQKEYRKTATKGFMGKSWDGGDIAFRKETWAALKEHLHPGAFCFAFASTRGLHRMMVAIEDAGFVIHPTIFLYSFGSGFPKATRIDTQTLPPLAKRWISHRYGLQALKPSCEPIICFQKRYEGKPVKCIVETGAGALNIDGGRIGVEARMTNGTFNKSGNNINKNVYSGAWESGYIQTKKQGRWPSNLIIDKECADRFPMTESESNNIRNNKNSLHTGVGNGSACYGTYKDCITEGYSDSGSAARYFKNVEMKIDAADPVFYTAKVSKDERNKGCEGMELKEKFWHNNETRDMSNPKNYIGGEIHKVYAKNFHPTLKSIDLTTYLATLLLPPLEYAPRRILVPFAGAGSEMIGCLKAGWEEIVGIELTAEYIPIIEARFEYYKKQIELEKSMQLFEPEIMESMNKVNKAEESLFGN